MPRWLRGTGAAGSPPSTRCCRARRPNASAREAARGRQSGRTQEIQRLIGRSLRAVTRPRAARRPADHRRLRRAPGRRRARARRRSAAGYVALHDACTRLVAAGTIARAPAHRRGRRRLGRASSTAVAMLDLPYEEDARADTDMNVVMTGDGRFVEVQGTAERQAFSRGRARRPARPRRGGHRARSTRAQREVLGDARPAADVTRVVLATANPHKAARCAAVLAAARIRGRGRAPRASPTSTRPATPSRATPLLKAPRAGAARPARRRSPTTPASSSTPSAAAPGVYSARYAGRGRHLRRQRRASSSASSQRVATPRRARFRDGDRAGRPRRARARGRRRRSRADRARRRAATTASATTRSSSPTTTPGRTLAELDPEEKNRLSHRGRALAALARIWPRDSCSRDVHL